MKIYIDSLDKGYKAVIEKGFSWLGLESLQGKSIAIKPNLTFPEFRPGVMTNPQAIEDLVIYLKNFTDNITVCEADSGGYNRFSMDDVFRKIGLIALAKKYGLTLLNLSHVESKPILCPTPMRTLRIPMPRVLLEETDLFITMPVPKIHMNTGVSLSIKNQWGIIQIPSERLKLHPYFKYAIYQVNKALPKAVSVVDGKYGLTRSGPMEGDVKTLNWLLIADNIFAADFLVCSLMGIDPQEVSYLRFILRKEKILSIDDCEVNCDYSQFRTKERFYLTRKWTDYPGLMAFNCSLLAYLGYHSPLAGLLHRILYKFRDPFYDYGKKK